MAEAAAEFAKHMISWIETDLVPKLVNEKYLIPDGDTELKSVHAEPLTVTGFALTTPFCAKIEVLHDKKVKEFSLVIKV